MNKIYDKIIDMFGPRDFLKGMNYQANKIKLTKINNEYGNKRSYFKITSERTNEKYDVTLLTNEDDGEIYDYTCTCPQYDVIGHCKHITACALKYEDVLFHGEEANIEDYEISIGKQILDSFYNPKKTVIKKKLSLSIELELGSNYYYNSFVRVNMKVGLDRLYTLNNKYRNFMYAYYRGEAYKLASKLTYNPEEHYFDKADKEILDYNIKIWQKGNYECIINNSDIDGFMEVLKDKTFKLNGYTYHGYSLENPFNVSLTKDDDKYHLTINNLHDFEFLIDDSNFIFDNKNIYKLNNDMVKLYNFFVQNNIESFSFNKEDLAKFTGGLLIKLKDNITLADNITEITLPTAPLGKLYFDFYYSSIECSIKLSYGNKEIDYFSKDPGIARDKEYENDIIQRLNDFGFILNDNHIVLEDIDQIGDFLEKGLFELSEEYEVFTSKKIKDTNILKKTQSTVTFSIGKDGILSYDFNIDGINGELTDVLTSLRAKKHYHKLKNGNYKLKK